MDLEIGRPFEGLVVLANGDRVAGTFTPCRITAPTSELHPVSDAVYLRLGAGAERNGVPLTGGFNIPIIPLTAVILIYPLEPGEAGGGAPEQV